ncbi:MAG: hypothetical protein JST16_08020 [Bdellovibrionales bacterium]|nr:hypothetical protein [Bdellovibrionales bacterium]
MNTCQLFAALTLSALLGACAPDSKSGAIDNSEFYVVNTITADPAKQTVTCRSDLTVGGSGGTTLTLSDEDSLSCSVDTTKKSMSKSSAGTYDYSDMSYSVGKTYSVTLERTGSSECGKSGTFTGSVTLPEAVNITSPANNGTVSRSTALTITWTAGTGDSIDLTLSGVSSSISKTTTDTGSTSFDASQMANYPEATGTLKLTRTKNGQHPSGIKGGSTQAVQTQSISINVN